MWVFFAPMSASTPSVYLRSLYLRPSFSVKPFSLRREAMLNNRRGSCDIKESTFKLWFYDKIPLSVGVQ